MAYSSFRPSARRAIALAGVGLFALAAHLCFLHFLPAKWAVNESKDYIFYYEPAAARIAAGQGLTLADGRPMLAYPPAVPILYAATFRAGAWTGMSKTALMTVLEALLVVVTAVLLALFAMSVFDWKIAIGGALLWATYPFYLWNCKQPETTSPFVIPLLLALWLLLRWAADGRRAALMGAGAGVLLAAASLARPIGIALPLVFIVLACLLGVPSGRRSKLAFCIFLIGAHLAAVAPWEIWAWNKSGHWIPLSTNGPASILVGLTIGAPSPGSQSTAALPPRVRELSLKVAAHVSELRTNGDIAGFLAARLREGITPVAELVLVKAARSWYGTDSQRLEGSAAALQAVYFGLILWGALLALRDNRKQKNFALAVLLVTAYFWAMTIVAISILRYMMPALYLLMPLAARTLGQLWARPAKTSAA